MFRKPKFVTLSDFICVPSTGCPPIDVPEHGEMECFDDGLQNQVCTFHCQNWTDLYGPDTITCKNGSWDYEPPVCARKCPFVVLYLSDSSKTSVRQFYKCNSSDGKKQRSSYSRPGASNAWKEKCWFEPKKSFTELRVRWGMSLTAPHMSVISTDPKSTLYLHANCSRPLSILISVTDNMRRLVFEKKECLWATDDNKQAGEALRLLLLKNTTSKLKPRAIF